jgi:hypothetical protein
MKSALLRILKWSIALALLFFISSCKDKPEQKNSTYIDIAGALDKGRIVQLSEIADEVILVPLETTDSSMIGNLSGVRNFVIYENGQFYIMDSSRSIWIFDKNGKFIRKFNRKGRGPEEYIDVSNFEVDPETGKIIVLSLDGKFYEYRQDGSFIRRVDPPVIEGVPAQIHSGYKVDDNVYICTVESGPDFENKKINDPYKGICAITFDSLSNLTSKIYSPEFISGSSTGNGNLVFMANPGEGFVMAFSAVNANLFRYHDNIRIRYDYEDIINSVDKRLEPDTAYTINLGEYQATRENFGKVWDFSSNIISLIGLTESTNYLYFWLNLRGLARDPIEVAGVDMEGRPSKRKICNSYALFNKKTGEFTLMDRPAGDQMGFKDDISGGLVFWPKYISSKDILVAPYTALEFIEFAENNNVPEKIRKIAEHLDENDNPVIALVKLKK